MTDPNTHIPSHHDSHGEMGTFETTSNAFIDITVDDYEQPCGENIMFNVEGNIDNPSRWESQNTQFVNDPSQAGTSGVHDQIGGQNAGYFDPENIAFEIPTQPLERPVPPQRSECSYCQVLREIIHCKGASRYVYVYLRVFYLMQPSSVFLSVIVIVIYMMKRKRKD